MWPWNLTDNIGKQQGTSCMPLEAICHLVAISQFEFELLSRNYEVSTKSLVLHKVWPWNLKDDLNKTIGHFFYATSSFGHYFKTIGVSKLKSQSGNAQFWSKCVTFCPVWPRNVTDDLKNIRIPLFYYFKLCASIHSHWWIQTGVTVRKPVSKIVLTSVALTCDL